MKTFDKAQTIYGQLKTNPQISLFSDALNPSNDYTWSTSFCGPTISSGRILG